MTARVLLPFLLAMGMTPLLDADLAHVKAEPNLEKRSKLALDNAETALRWARVSYTDGEAPR